jgi:hypothetical protein
VLRSQLTANPFPLALRAPGWASVFPEPSTMVISSSGNVEMTPLVEPAATVAPVRLQLWTSESG